MRNAIRFIGVLIVSFMALSMRAEAKWDYINQRNELRIGWGDQLFETLMWHKPTYVITTMPATYQRTYHEDYRYYQHLWLEYQWRFNHWFSLGGMVDGSGVSWSDVTRNGQGVEIGRDEKHHFYNIVIMPTIRFTYYHHPNVNLYSGLGLGMDINGGTESNSRGKKVDVGMALNMTVIGVSANYERWFWTVDFGGLTAFKDSNTIFMACSRIINVGLGARF